MSEALPGLPEQGWPVRPIGDVWTLPDLLRLPEDTNRYEIVDGSLLASPVNIAHLAVVIALRAVLSATAPASLRVAENAGVRVGRSIWVPDLVVIPAAVLRQRQDALESADVLLAVEVLSPSRRMTDLVTKRSGYASGRIPSYWIVDPEVPALTALRLTGEVYGEDATVRGGSPFDAQAPFPVRVVAADLIADLRP